MPERTFDMLEKGAQDEVRQLSAELDGVSNTRRMNTWKQVDRSRSRPSWSR